MLVYSCRLVVKERFVVPTDHIPCNRCCELKVSTPGSLGRFRKTLPISTSSKEYLPVRPSAT